MRERSGEEGERASADESAGVDFRVGGGGGDCDVVRFAHQPICSLSLPLRVCMFDGSSYETVISWAGVWRPLRNSPLYEN